MVKLDVEISKTAVERSLGYVVKYLAFYLAIGIVGDLFNNYFFVGTSLFSTLMFLMPWGLYLLLFYTIIILFLYVLGVFANVGRE